MHLIQSPNKETHPLKRIIDEESDETSDEASPNSAKHVKFSLDVGHKAAFEQAKEKLGESNMKANPERKRSIKKLQDLRKSLHLLFDKEIDAAGNEPGAKCCNVTCSRNQPERSINYKAVRIRKYPWAKKMANILDGRIMSSISLFLTILSLFLRDIVLICLPKSADKFFLHYILTFAVGFFILEIIAHCICKENFMFGFFFNLDVIGIISLLMDLEWVMEAIFGKDSGTGMMSVAKGARTGRAARTAGGSAKSTARFVKMLRMMRAFRAVKLFGGKAEEEETRMKPSRVGNHLAEQITKKTILIILLLLMITPNFEPDQGRWENVALHNMDMMNTVIQSDAPETTVEALSDSFHQKGIDFGSSLTSQPMIAHLLHLELDVTQNSTKTYINDSYSHLRNIETKIIFSDYSENSFAIFDIADEIREECVRNVLMILVIVFLFCIGSFIVANDANYLVVKPIERMTHALDGLIQLFIGKQNHKPKEEQELETDLLETLMYKMRQIFHIEGIKDTNSASTRKTMFTALGKISIEIKHQSSMDKVRTISSGMGEKFKNLMNKVSGMNRTSIDERLRDRNKLASPASM